MSDADDIVEAVKENLKHYGPDELGDAEVEAILSSVRSSKQRILLKHPRRGE